MLIYWLASNEREHAIEYLGNDGWYCAGLILVGATMAFGFNLSSYFFILLTSALTTTVAANGVKVINIVISALAAHISDTRNWLGVTLVCIALCVYAYFSYSAKKKPPPSLKLPFMKEYSKGAPDAEAGKATEGTPLTGADDSAVCCRIC